MIETLLSGSVPLRGVVLDLETTGLPPRKPGEGWPGVVQMGAVFGRADGSVSVFFRRCRIKPDAVVEPAALEVNGMTEAECRDPSLPTEEEAVSDLIGFISQAPARILYALNPGTFDGRFVEKICGDMKVPYPFGHRSVDLHSVARSEMERLAALDPSLDAELSIFSNRTDRHGNPTEDRGLHGDSALTYAGLPSEPKPHRADTGAIMEYEAFHRFIHHKPALARFKEHAMPRYLQQLESHVSVARPEVSPLPLPVLPPGCFRTAVMTVG